MPKYFFNSRDLSTGFTYSKLVKPESGDVCVQFLENSLKIFTSDNRRYIIANVLPLSTENVSSGFLSDEFYFMLSRAALFDSDLSSVIISITQSALNITASGGEETRQASLKKKSSQSRRTKIPTPEIGNSLLEIESKLLEKILIQASCSAQISETKTDEARRLNQIHFYSDRNCVISNARFFGSAVFCSGLNLDISIPSDDIPILKSFCSKSKGTVEISENDKLLFLTDKISSSILALSKIHTERPSLFLLDDKFTTSFSMNRKSLSEALHWACLSLAPEGTSRLSLVAEDGFLKFLFGNSEISKFPISFLTGNSLRQDYNAKHLSSIVDYLEDDDVVFRHGNPVSPTILEVSAKSDNDIQSKHYLQSMKER